MGGGRLALRRRRDGLRGRAGRRCRPRATPSWWQALRAASGSIAVQLARLAGATVIGLASETNHVWLAEHGMIPVGYGDRVAERIRAAMPKVDAFIDTQGGDYVQLALDLGVQPGRIDTIVNYAAVADYGVKAEGNAAGASAAILAELAGLVAAGKLEVPIAATFPLVTGAGRLHRA